MAAARAAAIVSLFSCGEPESPDFDFEQTPVQVVRDMSILQTDRGEATMRMHAPLMQRFNFFKDSLQQSYELYSDGFFGEILQPICARHGVTRFNAEPFTDVTQVRAKTNVMCFNVGNGGRLAHSPSEYLVVEDAQSAYALGKELLEAVGTSQHWFQ